MKFFSVVCTIATLLRGISAETCQSTNSGGTTCLAADELPSWMENYSGGETCFDFGGSDWCFVTTAGSLEPCECFDDNVTYDNEYCNPANYGTDNTMCIYDEGVFGSNCGSSGPISSGITDQADKDAIVAKHNELRAKVASGDETQGVGGGQPAAADMREMVWSDELATVAQRWTDQCTSGHDTNRQTANFASVGQNYAATMSSAEGGTTDWDYMIQMWYDEVTDFPPANVGSYSSNGATGVVGHYTQVVWADSYAIGCGFVYFNDGQWYTRQLICNYGPAGNYMNNPVYTEGKTASQCPSGTSATSAGLCN